MIFIYRIVINLLTLFHFQPKCTKECHPPIIIKTSYTLALMNYIMIKALHFWFDFNVLEIRL